MLLTFLTDLLEYAFTLLQFCSVVGLHYNLSPRFVFPQGQDSTLWPNTAQRKVPEEAVAQITFVQSLVFSLTQPQVRRRLGACRCCEIHSQGSSAARWVVCKTSAVEHWHVDYTRLHPKHRCFSTGSDTSAITKPKAFLW